MFNYFSWNIIRYINKNYLSLSSQNSFTTLKLNFGSIVFSLLPYIYKIILFIFLMIIVFLMLNPLLNHIKKLIWKTKPKPVIPKELRREPIIVEYDPPDNLPPIDIGTILDRRVDITDISSIIIDLAVRGYLKIRYIVQQIPFWPDKKDFELIKLKNGTDLTHPAYKIMFNLLFNGRNSVKLSDIVKQKTYVKKIKKIKEATEQYLYDKGYFDQAAKNKKYKLAFYSYIGFGLSIFLYAMGDILSGAIELFNGFNVDASIVKDFFAYFFPVGFVVMFAASLLVLGHKLTPKGLSVLKKILGFREFLQLTEKDRLELLNAPELQPEMFEKFLPYAMVLGVEDKWSQKFKDIYYNTIPNWYEDPTVMSFDSYILTNDLIVFNYSFNKVFNIPSTRSRSSSGFGGGGSSGGGSGRKGRWW
jgi:uncharacterized membrane protein